MQLCVAAHLGDGPAVARLLAAGFDPNVSVCAPGQTHQKTALVAAVESDRLEAARVLLDGGADPSLLDSEGVTPLMVAAMGGHLEVLRLLLARGAAVDAADKGIRFTAFHYACFRNHAECA